MGLMGFFDGEGATYAQMPMASRARRTGKPKASSLFLALRRGTFGVGLPARNLRFRFDTIIPEPTTASERNSRPGKWLPPFPVGRYV